MSCAHTLLFDSGGQSVVDNKQVGGDGVTFKEPLEGRQMTLLLLRVLLRSGNIPQAKEQRPLAEYGRTTFYLNKVRKGSMWHNLKVI